MMWNESKETKGRRGKKERTERKKKKEKKERETDAIRSCFVFPYFFKPFISVVKLIQR